MDIKRAHSKFKAIQTWNPLNSMQIEVFESKPQACNFIKKEAPTQVFSFEFCEIFKNTFFTEHLRWLLLFWSIINLEHGIMETNWAYFDSLHELFHDRGPYHIETSALICSANHWTSFYMIGTSVMKKLIIVR